MLERRNLLTPLGCSYKSSIKLTSDRLKGEKKISANVIRYIWETYIEVGPKGNEEGEKIS